MNQIKIIFVAFGSLGDVYPLVPIAQKLSKNYSVIFLANEYFKPVIESAGLEHFSLGTTEEQIAALESKSSTGETDEGKIHRFEHIIGKNFERAFDFLEGLMKAGDKPVVVSHGNLSPAVPACEKFHIPLILAYYAPSQIPYNQEDSILYLKLQGKNEFLARHFILPWLMFKSRLSFDIKPAYNEYRKKFNLPPIQNQFEKWLDLFKFKKREVSGLHIPLEICLTPEWFCEPLGNKLGRIHFVGFPFYNECQADDEPRIDDFIKKNGKPIVFTPGTAVEDVEQFAREIVPICRKLGSPAIFASRHGEEVFKKMELPDDVPVLFLRHADFSFLLPKSRCLIHHGGIGTIAQAVKACIPQIVRPRMYDQPVNGIRVMMNGLGGCLFPEAFHADSVASVLDHVENNLKIQEFLNYYSEQVNAEDAVAQSAKLIDEYIKAEIVKHVESFESSPVYSV